MVLVTGQGIIKSINSATEIQLDPEKLDLPTAFTDVDYEIRETPVYEVKGGSFGINEIFGVDVTEAQVSRTAASGDAFASTNLHTLDGLESQLILILTVTSELKVKH